MKSIDHNDVPMFFMLFQSGDAHSFRKARLWCLQMLYRALQVRVHVQLCASMWDLDIAGARSLLWGFPPLAPLLASEAGRNSSRAFRFRHTPRRRFPSHPPRPASHCHHFARPLTCPSPPRLSLPHPLPPLRACKSTTRLRASTCTRC